MTESTLPTKVPERVTSSLAAALTAAELDQQISTARAWPRSIRQFVQESQDLVSLSVDVAEECIYAIPRDRKIIRGPSARFAEVLLSRYSNCRVSSRVVDENDQWITAQGIFHDLETNAATAYEVRRRITDKHGRKFSLDMIGVTANAACSIAMRQAVLKGIPKAIWSAVYATAEKTIAGDNRPLNERRDAALGHFKKLGIAPERVFASLSIGGYEDLGSEELLTLQGIKQAIRDGEYTLEEAFPPLRPAVSSRTEQAKALLGKEPERPEPEPQPTPEPDEPPPPVDTTTGEMFGPEDKPELPISDERATPPKKD